MPRRIIKRERPGSLNDIRWMQSERRGRGPPKHKNNTFIEALYHSSKLTNKNLLSSSLYIFECWPLPPHLCIHSCDECSKAFPVFHCSATKFCVFKWKVKTLEAWEQLGLTCYVYWLLVFHETIVTTIKHALFYCLQ